MLRNAPRELRFADIDTFLLVHRLGSVSAAARELMVTASQVSKAVRRIEEHFGVRLFQRSARGMILSEQGHRLAPRLEEILARLRDAARSDDPARERIVTIAAPSYVSAFLVPDLARAVPEMRIRSLEMPPAALRALAGESAFDAAILAGAPRLPSTWEVTLIGTCRIALFASPRVAEEIGPQPVGPQRLRPFAFVHPVCKVGGTSVPVDDDCPMAERRRGHEAQSFGVALELAARTDQLVYGPAFAAAQQLKSGTLVEVAVQGWNNCAEMYFACNAETMLARVQSTYVEVLRQSLARLESTPLVQQPESEFSARPVALSDRCC